MSLFSLPVRVSRVRWNSLCSAALGCFLLLPGTAVISAQTAVTAQTAANGTVRGLVTDPDGAIVPGATVMLTPAKGNGISVKSGSDGTFHLQVPAGTYTMSVTLEGFATYNRPGVKLAAGQSLTVDAKLTVGDTTTVVNVVSDAAMVSVDPDNAASSTVIKGKDLEALSDDPDELSAELSALAGPAAGPNGGQIYVDGFTGGQLPPKSSIREIRINQNPFSAEYDKLGYGRVEVFTKPGTDKFHGMLSVQGDTRQFNTSNPFLGSANSQPDYHTFFLLGNLTGPLTKSSSFSIGGSRRDISQNSIVNPTFIYANSPNSTTLCNPGDLTCQAYTYPASARAVLAPQLRSDISPRVDFALGPKNVLTARYQYEGGSQTNGGLGNTSTLPSAAYASTNNEHTIQLSDTQTVSSKMVNETRFEYQRSESKQTPNTVAPTLIVQGTITGGGSSSQNNNSVLRHIELQNYTSIALSTHFVRFGGRLRMNHEDLTSTSGSNGAFTYNNLLDPCADPNVTNKPSGCAGLSTTIPCQSTSSTADPNYISSYQCGRPSQFRFTRINQGTISASQNDVGLYAEDDWKIKPNLTFSYGVRLEAQNAIGSPHDFAPRLSVAYGIPRAGGKPPMTVVRAGFGMFYDRFALDNLLTYEQLRIRSGGVQAQQQVTVQNPNPATCTPTLTAPFTACGTGVVSRVSQYTLAPNLRSSYTMLGAVGFDQQLSKLGTISVNYLVSRGNHEYLTRVDTSNPNLFNYTFNSGGVFREQQLFVNANIRTRSVNMFGFYALTYANSNTSGAGFIPTSNNPRVDYGRASFATRSYGVMGGTWNAPYKFNLSPFLIVRSGQPYNITTGTDVNNDSVYNDRPALNSSVPFSCRSAASFTTPAQGASYTEIPVNYCTGPANYSVNLRLARTFGFGPRTDNGAASGTGGNGDRRGGNRGGGGGMHGPGGGGPGGGPGGRGGFGGGNSGQRYNVTFGVQAQNVFNVVPYSTPVSTLTNARFGTFTNIAQRPFSSGNAVRSLTLQATFNF